MIRLFQALVLTTAAAALALAPPAHGAATQSAKVNVKVVKPLTLTWVQDLSLGSILLGPGTWSGATVALTRTGAFSCAAPLICTGATQVARYKVTGTNNQTAVITAPNVVLVNQANAAQKLTMTVDNPRTVTFTNSGPTGQTFSLGGSISLSSSTPDGTYVGTFNVTVDYQ